MRKLLLDENVTPKAAEIFRELGYDVESVHSLGLRGMSDSRVLEAAVDSGRILLTHNGKDFILLVPPRLPDVVHQGILWFKFQVTRRNVDVTCRKIHAFFERVSALDNSVWEVLREGTMVIFSRYVPGPNVSFRL
ncbi:DUF5615 family PIN-like protein [Staphylospora marina]|uniref:DUF5615 family PIN-like protein n=1 Tax=Staphylospora marina TaxID=2490858 RepID=UPI000F5C22FE|nr:DUF5615 family PIN-like protein [Staphylospora marina]